MRREEDLDKEQVEGEEYTVMGNKICGFEVVGGFHDCWKWRPRKVQPCPDEEEGGVNWSLDCKCEEGKGKKKKKGKGEGEKRAGEKRGKGKGHAPAMAELPRRGKERRRRSAGEGEGEKFADRGTSVQVWGTRRCS